MKKSLSPSMKRRRNTALHEHEPDRGKAVREFQPTMTEDQLAADYEVYPRFRNDIAVSEIRIRAKGVQVHWRIAAPRTSMSRWPYCAIRFRFDRKLEPFEADPPDCLCS